MTTQHNFGDRIKFVTFPTPGGKRRKVVEGEFRSYAGASSMAVLIDGQVRFVPVANEVAR